MTATIVPANPGFFVIHARPGETAPYEIFSRLSIIAWRIDDESQIRPEPVTPESVCQHSSDPRAVLHPNDSVTSLSGRVVGRNLSRRKRVAGGLLHTGGAGDFRTSVQGCVIHAMSVHGFTACRSRISEHVGQGFHGMSVQRFRACRSSS